MTWLSRSRQARELDDELKGAVAAQRAATERVKVAAVQHTIQTDNVRETLGALLDQIERRRHSGGPASR